MSKLWYQQPAKEWEEALPLTFILPNGEKGTNSLATTMDNQIIRDLFNQCISAAQVLDIDDELNQQLKAPQNVLFPPESEDMDRSWNGLRIMRRRNLDTVIFLNYMDCILLSRLQWMEHLSWLKLQKLL